MWLLTSVATALGIAQEWAVVGGGRGLLLGDDGCGLGLVLGLGGWL